MKIFLLSIVFLAHDAAPGIRYDGDCCGGQDCEPYPAEDVTPLPYGWRLADGEIVRRDKERPSPDGRYHRCVRAGWWPGAYWPKTNCFYVPRQTS